MNAEIEHALPYGNAEGEKPPREKKKIEPAFAMRPALPPARRFSDTVIAVAVLGVQVFWAARTLKKWLRKLA